jgi:hypothetical protein
MTRISPARLPVTSISCTRAYATFLGPFRPNGAHFWTVNSAGYAEAGKTRQRNWVRIAHHLYSASSCSCYSWKICARRCVAIIPFKAALDSSLPRLFECGLPKVPAGTSHWYDDRLITSVLSAVGRRQSTVDLSSVSRKSKYYQLSAAEQPQLARTCIILGVFRKADSAGK